MDLFKKDKELAINLFLKNTNYNFEQIKKIKKIHYGFTNISFLFLMNDKNKFQIRIGKNNSIVNRLNEINILKIINNDQYVYIDENGNAIKKWIKGNTLSLFINKKKKLELLSKEIINLHDKEMNDSIIKHDYYSFVESTVFFDLSDKKLYLELIEKYKNLKLVISHNDINTKNMIYDSKKNKIYLIDFEWGRINNEYWDLANFYRETNLHIKWLVYMKSFFSNLDLKILYDFVYITTNFAYQWTYNVDQTEKILKYRKKIIKKLINFRKLISI